jgi:hypothetical protein
MWNVEEDGGVVRVLVGKPEGTRPFEIPRQRWEDNIQLDPKETEWGGEGMGWIDLAQDRNK